MTREEAIAKLQNFADHCYPNEEFLMAIEALFAKPCVSGVWEHEPCDDCISRQAAIDFIRSMSNANPSYWNKCDVVDREDLIDGIGDLSPVTPKQKMGRWIEKDGYDGDTYYDCSECGESWSTIEGTPWDNVMKYCPNCGAKMIESQGKCLLSQKYKDWMFIQKPQESEESNAVGD